jgi:hypothetical protein
VNRDALEEIKNYMQISHIVTVVDSYSLSLGWEKYSMKWLQDRTAKGSPQVLVLIWGSAVLETSIPSTVSFFILVYLYMSSASCYFNKQFMLGCLNFF